MWTLAFAESQQLTATSIAFCPDFYSFPIQDGEGSTAPPAPPAARCLSSQPFPNHSWGESPKHPSLCPRTPVWKCRVLCEMAFFPPHSGTSRRGYPPERRMQRGEDAEFLLSLQNNGKLLKFSKNILGKSERKVAAAGKTQRERGRGMTL